MSVLIITPKENKVIHPTGLIALGGKKASGLQFSSLSKDDDYLVLSPLPGGSLSIVPLKGKIRTPYELAPLEKAQIEDMLIIPLQALKAETTEKKNSLQDILPAVKEISEARDGASIYEIVLQHVLKLSSFDRGLVVAKTPQGSFEIVAHQGADPSAPWLSESLLEETLTSGEALLISNVIGSRFEKNQSLMGTGFLSVASWPLQWKGEVVGAIIGGSPFPHDGTSTFEKEAISLLAPFVAQNVAGWIKEKRLVKLLARFEKESLDDSPFLSQSPIMMELMRTARRVAPSDLSVLIQGETGVGKEVMAKWLHQKGPNSKGQFVAVNCGAIPENLIESTLFGHKKGSFTGAISDQTGKFVQAHGGTIFLDEIADLPLNVQGKLLRVLQEKSVEPVGSSRSISVQVRVLSASHKDLWSLVQKGQFREDLYYRLAEVTLEIPPLRSRPEDAILLVQDFLTQNEMNKKISPDAWEWIQNQKWPGNVRELLSAFRRAVLLSQNETLEARDFFVLRSGAPAQEDWLGGKNLDHALKKFQIEKVKAALQKSQGNRQQAAKLLGVTSRTLFRYLEDIREVEV